MRVVLNLYALCYIMPFVAAFILAVCLQALASWEALAQERLLALTLAWALAPAPVERALAPAWAPTPAPELARAATLAALLSAEPPPTAWCALCKVFFS